MPQPSLMLLPGMLCDASVFRLPIADLDGVADVQVPSFYGFASLAEMARSVLEQAPPHFSLAGFSMGARVAFEIVRTAPDRVERLCVFGTGVAAGVPGEAERRRPLIDLAHRGGMRALAEAWVPPMVDPVRRADIGFMDGLFEMVTRATAEIFEKQTRALLDRPDLQPVLATIRCPTLVIAGARDAIAPPAQSRAITDAIPGARFALVEDSGHFIPVEQPAAFAALLREWLLADRR